MHTREKERRMKMAIKAEWKTCTLSHPHFYDDGYYHCKDLTSLEDENRGN